MSYFKKTDAFITGNQELRLPQRIAHTRLKEAFIQDPESHKMIVLPTGTGKTGLIAIAPYEISDGRVLVITPNLVIREGISEAFDTRVFSNFWQKRNVIIDEEKLPSVYRYAGFATPTDKRRVLRLLEGSDIVIANIQKVYSTTSKKALVNILDKDFFDMIIIDEAHHSAAESWLKTLEHFTAKKIVKLTATPFRSDLKELDGEIIYQYELADAISDGLIKNIVAEDYTNERLEFVIDGERVDKETALEQMDKNWVTRSVAYSTKCSETIVKMSIERLNEKRKLGKAHHQIIAVACGIDHAREIKHLYEQHGLTAAVVTSDQPDEAEDTIIQYKKAQIDVVVNVNMLGEGFDHANISIAAIFRPFRTLPPYAQFIGRALRKIPDANDAIDNIAHVIYHKELDLDELWAFYTGAKEKGERRKVIEVEFDHVYSQNRDIGEVDTDGRIIGTTKEFLADGVAKHYGQAITAEINAQQAKIESFADALRKQGHTEEEIEDYKKLQYAKLDNTITEKRNKLRDELIREELHKVHQQDILDQVDKLIADTGIDPRGNQLPASSTNQFLKSSPDNLAYIMKSINSNLKSKLKRGIDEWETYDFTIARAALPEIIQSLKQKIERLGIA
ncbi:DEAD/DEAH box helicase family protein [Brevibacillus agri]|uniref:DEAD/DEAH box helicase n=1 Tax=Brevibacillus agri TaxID=51101 RepID=UPI002E20E150|nr:DEAD/DEAH box helicase family protein [Brevibacillus agri]MED4569648.1 DEAD/DEAH box helicase family protein [Brevibacillus agri]